MVFTMIGWYEAQHCAKIKETENYEVGIKSIIIIIKGSFS